MKEVVAVLFGGRSSEHDISIITGLQTLKALNKEKYEILPIYIAKSGQWFSGKSLFNASIFSNFNEKQKGIFKVGIFASNNFLYIQTKTKKFKKYCKLDCAILCMHGVNGEDGSLQGLLEINNIPYTSSGVLGSSVCMDKVIMKRLFESIHLPVVPWFYVVRDNIKNEIVQINEKILSSFYYPVIVKPANLGSSIGISTCNNQEELLEGLLVASEYDSKILIEKCITSLKEINCSVLGYGNNIKASSLEEPVNYKNFLSFNDKYLKPSGKGGMSNLSRILPAKITKKQAEIIAKFSKKAFVELEQAGVVRIDFMIDEDDKKIYINEINTIPGSLAFYLWEYDKLSFAELLDKLIALAKAKKNEKEKNKYAFASSVLLNFAGGAKTGLKNNYTK